MVNATDPLGNPGFKVTWTPVAGATTYRVYWRNIGSNAGWSFVDTTNGTTKTLTAANSSLISAGSNMAVYVSVNNCPTNPILIGDPSTVSYLTLTPVSSCLSVPTFSATSNCPNQISITGLSGSSGNYQIMLRRISPTFSSGVAYTVSPSNINITIGAQFSGSVYEVTARSICSSTSYSGWSNPIIVNVKPACQAINNPIISNTNCFGGTVSWNSDNCNGIGVSGYYLYIKKSTSTSYSAYPTSANTYSTITWLQPNTSYNIFVRSVACNGSLSANSQVLTFTTAGPGCREDESESIEKSVANQFVSPEGISVNVFPNPANEQVTVIASGLLETEARVELMNLLGQVVATNIEPVSNGVLQSQFTLNHSISSGMYLLRISSGTINITRQLIVAH